MTSGNVKLTIAINVKNRIIPCIALCFVLVLAGCQPSSTTDIPSTLQPSATSSQEANVTPADSPDMPERGFFMGVLPIPADAQSFEDVYHQASTFTDFAPVWGRPTPFYDMANELATDWGKTFVEQYTRGSGMFLLIHMSFIGAGMSLTSPAGVSDPTLSNPEWR